jgi:cellulose synthase (UDP-forming)
MGFYFDQFETRKPPPPLRTSTGVELTWQFLAVCALIFGANYIRWRWADSLNPDALWFAVPLALAETLAYIGLILFVANLWSVRDYPRQAPPESIRNCVREGDIDDRPVSVDIFIATYSEDVELVRLTIRDAVAVRYPGPIDRRVHVLDDGRRAQMREVCEQEGVNYITRSNNIGFKAGNLRNALEQTGGDFIVICDADTRLFPDILVHTLGYFRDPDVAWIQTPQWFYDIPSGKRLGSWLGERLGGLGGLVGRALERVVGPIQVGRDPFISDPQMFYDVILRRRNAANAAFCCGAASIHRREAVMQSALRAYAAAVDQEVRRLSVAIRDEQTRRDFQEALRAQLVVETEFTPYKFHVSEDIYTSIVLHNDPDRRWKSVLHPEAESKMLSPQDLLSWSIQRFKYAGGTLDILFHDNPLFKGRMSAWQRVMYLSTFWSYLGCLWNLMFLVAPIVAMFTAVTPVAAYSSDFYAHFLPFIVLNELAFLFGTWGVAGWDGKASYLAFFSINLRALWTVMRGEKIKFPVTPKDRQDGNFLHLVVPQMAIIVLTLAGIAYSATRVFGFDHPEETPSFLVNLFWGLNNAICMLPTVRAAMWKPGNDDPEPTGEVFAR